VANIGPLELLIAFGPPVFILVGVAMLIGHFSRPK
jgi:hypothetical protein